MSIQNDGQIDEMRKGSVGMEEKLSDNLCESVKQAGSMRDIDYSHKPNLDEYFPEKDIGDMYD